MLVELVEEEFECRERCNPHYIGSISFEKAFETFNFPHVCERLHNIQSLIFSCGTLPQDLQSFQRTCESPAKSSRECLTGSSATLTPVKKWSELNLCLLLGSFSNFDSLNDISLKLYNSINHCFFRVSKTISAVKLSIGFTDLSSPVV